MHILLFGGSFNPPHIGHLIVIQQAFELVPDIDQLWLLPAYSHTFQKQLAPAPQRLEMSRLLIESLPSLSREKTKLCPLEIDYQTSGETFQTLQLLKTEKDYLSSHGLISPETSLDSVTYSFLMGTDQLPHFEKWGRWRDLLKEMHFYLYPRAGYSNDCHFEHMTLLQSDTQVITNISSTLIRNRISSGKTVRHLLPGLIQEFLKQTTLY